MGPQATVEELSGLVRRCLARDGGLPLAASPEFVRSRWLGGRAAGVQGRTEDGRLVAAGALRAASREAPSAAGGAVPDAPAGSVIAGMVDPGFRAAGLGARLLDVALAEARRLGGPITVETESWTPAADHLFGTRGLRQTFAEDVLRYDLAHEVPEPRWPGGTVLREWSGGTALRFFAAYEAAFRERPGFPGWTAGEWIGDEDDDFRPEWSVLATLPDGSDAGFITGSAAFFTSSAGPVTGSAGPVTGSAGPVTGSAAFVTGSAGFVTGSSTFVTGSSAFVTGSSAGLGPEVGAGWIDQVGVVPAARGRGIGGALVTEALRRMRAAGAAEAWLTVNVDNRAAGLYRRLGFEDRGRRARYGLLS